MDLPRITTQTAIERFREEIQNLADRVSSHYGVSIPTDTIKACLEASNRTHTLLQRVRDLVRERRLNLTGRESIEIFRAGGILARTAYDMFLERMIDDSGELSHQRGVPILLTGSMLENPEIVSEIEACGGSVVADDLCVTGRQCQNSISLTGDPMMALARHYLLRPPCARMQEHQRRIEYVLDLVRSGEVRGVIYYVLKFCDTFLYEAPVLKQKLGQMGIPMLIIESEYRRGCAGGMQTRIQAFLEMVNASGDSQAVTSG